MSRTVSLGVRDARARGRKLRVPSHMVAVAGLRAPQGMISEART